MSRRSPSVDCADISLPKALALEPPAQVALEDYARVLTRAQSAEVVLSDSAGHESEVVAVHVCGMASPTSASIERDIADFACELAVSERGGLGWS